MKTGFYGRMIIIVVALLAICGLAVSGAMADGSDYRYEILPDGTVMLTGYIGTETNLILPETIDGYTVSVLDDGFSLSDSVREIISLTIPNTLTDVQPGALWNAGKLQEIRIAKDHPTLEFKDGVLYNKKERSILLYLQTNTATDFSVPDGVKAIEKRAFFGSKLRSISIPGNVECIGKSAFDHCHGMQKIYLHEGLKTIGDYAFYNIRALESITIPASVTEIGADIFGGCLNLKEINVAPGSSVFSVSDGALINVRDGILMAYPMSRKTERVVIPAGVKRINEDAFYGCKYIKQVVFPDGLLEIGNDAFRNCDGLISLDLPDSVEQLGSYAINGCYKVTQLHIPAGLKKIDNSNFVHLAITELTIPDSVTYIGDCFSYLKNLTEVVIPNSVTTIDKYTFTNCANLVRITIPASVTEIGDKDYTFTNNSDALVIKVEAGSYAEQWCRESGFKYEVISSGSASSVSAPRDAIKTTLTSRSQTKASSPLSIFMAELASHTDNLEENFTVPCSKELQEKLFQDSSIYGEPPLSTIMSNEGVYDKSCRRNPDSIEFDGCRYYEGKRIVHAVRAGKVSALTAQEKRTLEKAQQMVAGIKGSELEKERAIHDLLCGHVTYHTTGQAGHGEMDCAIGAILNGSADCEGYSDAFYLLAGLTGLRIRYQDGMIIHDNGTREGHMWNLININGRWVMLDVPSDDQTNIQYIYFNFGTDYNNKKHRWDEDSVLVSVEKDPSNDFRPAGLEWSYVTNLSELRSVLESKAGKQERIFLKYPASFNLKQQTEQLDNVLQTLRVEGATQVLREYAYGPDCMELFLSFR